MAGDESTWTTYREKISELEALHGATGVLSWDQQTYMPKGGAGHRGEQLAALSAVFHERMTTPALGELIGELLESEDPLHAASARRVKRRYDRATKVPVSLVKAMSKARSEGFGAWMKAREAGDFAPFEAALTELVRVTRETAAAIDGDAHPYDAMLAEYDPGSTVAELDPMFARLESELVPFVRSTAGREGPAGLDGVHVPADALRTINQRVIAALGFREEDGRLDESQHPFTVGIGPHDVRLTTHLYEDDLLGTLGGTIHECGHGLYEQGIPDALVGTGLGEAAGVGLHESQSRFWENVIGRSPAFCRWLVPLMKEAHPDLDLTPERLYGAANRVDPSLIRIKADEATYNLHILIRYRLETALLTGDLPVADAAAAWDEAYERMLGIRPGSPTEGVLQDVHWASGYFGYFPSYTIGNLYASSFKACIEQDLPDLWDRVEAGDFAPVLDWLREKVHHRGAKVDAPEVFRDAVGDRDPVADLMAHLRSRHGALYGVG
jgi:carboxypeptidase Taq